ncbi:MAG: ectoine/hydroxyectoine ABC transporter substrate-binding protein EhuB [Dehalococcoidia bacterium]|nr:ectoine/hydroxyectoine ABC transporter substrate-binding protein EhuB [Dehalococcoidia bacterium]
MSNDQSVFRRFAGRPLMIGLSFVLIAVLSLGLIACGDDDDDDGGGGGSTLEKAQEDGVITIGFANEAPYGFADSSGEATGEAPTVAKAILAELGINEVVSVVVPFGNLIPGLEAGRFDIIAAGMFINPGRCEQILFSDPDYCVPQAFGVEAGNPMGIMTFDDIAANPDIKVGIPTGGVEDQYARDAGATDDQITNFDTLQDAGDALAAGRVDAIAATSLAIQAELERLGDDGLEATPGFDVVIDGKPASGCGGFGFRKSDDDLHKAFNDKLIALKDSDGIRPLVEEFGFDDEVDAAKGRTAEELCTE